MDTTGLKARVFTSDDDRVFYDTVQDYEDVKWELLMKKPERDRWIELDLGDSVVFIPTKTIKCVVPIEGED